MADTCLDVEQDIISLIEPLMNTAIDGKIYTQQSYPGDDGKTNIVIRCFTCSNDPIQVGFANVKIHAPNIAATIGNNPQNLPNHKEFERICDLLYPLLDSQYRDSFNTNLKNTGELFEDKDGSFVTVIRVRYNSIQFSKT